MVTVKYIKLSENVQLPVRQSTGAAGYDVTAYLEEPLLLKKGEIKAVPTGLKVEIPDGYMISVRPRSGLSLKYGITCINSPGTIDCDFRGEIKILMINSGSADYTIQPGERIAQFVLEKVYDIDWQPGELQESNRGEAGFGSTGRH